MTRRFIILLFALLALLVGVPAGLAYLAGQHVTPEIVDSFLYMIYFRLPCFAFGRQFFHNDIAVAPNGPTGWVLTSMFYAALSVVLTLAVSSFWRNDSTRG